MHTITLSNLRQGDVLAEALVLNNTCFEENHIVTSGDKCILKQKGISQVRVLELNEIKNLVFGNSAFVIEYANFLVSYMQHLTCPALRDNFEFTRIKQTLVSQLLYNRRLLWYMIKLHNHHSYTFQHSLNVGVYAYLLGSALGLSCKEKDLLLVCGLYHDIGKLKTPVEILDSPDRLTKEQYKIMKRHSRDGYNILIKQGDDIPAEVLAVALYHHEKLNGTGYPNKLKNAMISNIVRIITVCDMFDAICCERSYHSSRAASEGIEILHEEAEKGNIEHRLVGLLNEALIFDTEVCTIEGTREKVLRKGNYNLYK